MKRLSVSFCDEIFAKLEARAIKNGNHSIANEVRELVDLGLKVEEASQKNGENVADETTLKLIEMLKTNLTWSMETRLLARYMVDKLPDTGDENHGAILDKFKEKSANYVEGMLNASVR